MLHRSLLEKLSVLERPDSDLNVAIYAACQGFQYEQTEDQKYRFFQGGLWIKPGEQYPDSGQFVLYPIPDYTGQWNDALTAIPYPWRLGRVWEAERLGTAPFWTVEVKGNLSLREGGLYTSEKHLTLSAGSFRLVTAGICFVGLQARILG